MFRKETKGGTQTMKPNTIYKGNSLEILKTFPDESIDCVMTSPPYWALRDYGVDEQLGLEPTFQEYITKLCDIFDEIKRVLKKTGTCWVNLGDTYGGKIGSPNAPKLSKGRIEEYKSASYVKEYIPSKSLCQIPSRFSIEMVNRGWILRNTIIWHKPNCMPSSVKDRFTVDFEYVFFFVKNKKYWFETQYEPIQSNYDPRKDKGRSEYSGKWKGNKDAESYGSPRARTQRPNQKAFVTINSNGRNKRAVWQICPKPFPEAHFAVYPEELCKTPIKSGCPAGGIVLDPFIGAGTTGIVALKQNKKFVGIELSQDYIDIANKRLKPYLEQTKLM